MRSNPTGTAAASPGLLLRKARLQQGLTQRDLAARAGTTQSSISRIEADAVSPTVGTLERLLGLMGVRLELSSSALEDGVDRTLLAQNLSLEPEARVRRGLAFAQLAKRNRGAVFR